MDWMPLAFFFALVLTVTCYYWIRPRSRDPRPTPLPPELRAQLSLPLAAWLEATRALRAKLLTFERQTTDMLRDEPQAQMAGGRRRYGREIDDVNFLTEVRKVRWAGQEWLALGEALPASDRAQLELDGWAERFAFPWRSDEEASRSGDRAPELRALLEHCAAASRALAEVDDAASASAGAPYRGAPS